jgi:hypothetical protein
MLFVAKQLIYYSKFFALLPIIFLVWRYRLIKREMWAVGVYMLLAVCTQFMASLLGDYKINNLPLLHIYTPVEFLCIVWFYYRLLGHCLPARYFWWLGLGFVCLSGLNSLFLQNIFTFNTYARSLEGLLTISLCLFWCYRTLLETRIQNLEDEPAFWVNTGFLVYFSGGVLLFAFSNYILDINLRLNIYIWGFHALLSILLYIFISVGIWKAR